MALIKIIKKRFAEIKAHIIYESYAELGSLLRLLTYLKFPMIFYIQLKYYMDDREKTEKICEYVSRKFLYQPPYLEKPYLLCLIRNRASYRQYAFITHVLLQFCQIRTKLMAGNCNETPMNWGHHFWNEVDIDGKYDYVDTLNFSGFVPKTAYGTKYQTDRGTSIAINVYFNEIFVARHMKENAIWTLKSRIEPVDENRLSIIPYK